MNSSRQVLSNARSAAEHCGDRILQLLKGALAKNGIAALAISGGSSPRPMFEHMATARFSWNAVHIFWVDERGVPPEDPQSNYGLARETFLDRISIPEANIHRIVAEMPAEEAARRYSDDLRQFFSLSAGQMPEFDVIHRGIGPDAHTASLFPGEPLIANRKDLAAAVRVEKFRQWRITLLPGPLLAARETVMLVAGADKAAAVQRIFEGPADSMLYPAQLFAREGRNTTWFFDAPAAALLRAGVTPAP